MADQKLNQDLEWVPNVDPNKVYDVLVKFACVSNDEKDRNNFVPRWSTNWYDWRFGDKPVFRGKLIREITGFWGEGHVPNLRVICCSEHYTEKTEQVVNDINKALLKILIEARLRPNAKVA